MVLSSIERAGSGTARSLDEIKRENVIEWERTVSTLSAAQLIALRADELAEIKRRNARLDFINERLDRLTGSVSEERRSRFG